MKHSVKTSWAQVAGARAFLRDKAFSIALALLFAGLTLLLLTALRANGVILVVTSLLFVGFLITSLTVEYWRQRNFYRALLVNLARLDQAYLVLETLEVPHFYAGRILYDTLYAINKSMHENVKIYQDEARTFREYIELWVHEIKTPLTALSLMNRDPKIAQELRRLDDFVDQVLYFSRAENAEHDYLIGQATLSEIVHQVALRNQPLFRAKNVDFSAHDLNFEVYTDAKWLEFIIGQIVNNSLKYGSKRLEISARADESTILSIQDDGIGIDPKDLPRVFEPSFTGRNGRRGKETAESSTGMGLYIVKTLCDKLGHQIKISSRPGEGTTVEITFSGHDYYLTKK